MVNLEEAGAAGWERETAALRALARQLLRDEHAAEDAVQETWLRALARGPLGGEGVGRWMRTVLRNVARDTQRVAGRRAAREEAVARSEAVPSGPEITERLEVVQRLAAEVAALAEPYRTAVHLRYFEGLAPDAIARRLGVPRETVRTRLRRGLALLRERMDAHPGGRGAWAAALVPLSRGAVLPVLSSPWTGGLLVAAKTKIAIAAAVVLAGTAGFLAYRDRAPAPGPDVAGVAPPAELEAPPDPGPAPTRQRASQEPGREPVEPVAANAAGPAPEPTAATDEVEVAGHVVIVDETGARRERTSGELELVVNWAPDNRERRTVAFADGRFTVFVPARAVLGVGSLVAEGRAAVPEHEAFLVEHSRLMEVRGEWQREGWLRVLDAESGAELAGVDVLRRWRWRAISRAVHPGDAPEVEVVATDAASPVLLPGLPMKLRTVAHWVRAPGYAWSRVDLDPDAGGTRTVELVEGGALAVDVLGVRPAGELRARVYTPERADGSSWDAAVDVRADEGAPTNIADLQPGRYVVRIDQGEYGATVTLGRAEALVRAGETATVAVSLDPAALDVPRTRLAGTLRLPPGFERAGVNLSISPYPWDSIPGQERVLFALAALPPAGADAEVLAWDAGEVRRGVYLAYVTGVQHREPIDARNAPETIVDLVVPPLATLELSVVDGATGEPLAAQVMWADGDLEGVTSNSWSGVAAGAPGFFAITAPRGEIQVSATAEGRRVERRTVRLEGDTRLTLALERASGIRLSFWEGDARVPIASEVRLRALRDPETGAELSHPRETSADSLERTLTLPPGRYEVELSDPPQGYRPIEPFVVEVEPEEVAEVRVPVAR